MPKTTTQADKQALLAKMERDRQELASSRGRPASLGTAGAAWAKTTALAAGAAVGWPPFLKQPLRAMAAMALRDRFADLLSRRNVRRVSGTLPDAELAQLAQMTSALRAAALRSADPREIEVLRAQLDDRVRRLRALRNARTALPPPA